MAVNQNPAELPGTDSRVLIVDDNVLIINVLKSLLKTDKYQVFCCANGAEGLALLKEQPVDLIICDVMMPSMDGYAFHHAVRQKSEFSHIPFVFLTALGEMHDVSHGKELGADDYIVKPFDPAQLLAVVRGKVTRARTLKLIGEERFDSYRRRVVHTLSHEFRTPLVAINTGTELLLEQHKSLDQDRVKHLLEAIQRGGQRLERLVTDFMYLQQIEAGIAQQLYTDRAVVRSIADVVDQLIEGVSEELAATGYTVRFSDFSAGRRVRVYEPQVYDILERIISNARKFSPDHREIEVAIVPGDNVIRVEIRDRGIGIDMKRLHEAVHAFGQLDRERLEQQGGGLGLAIANQYARIHGGSLDFERRQEGGTIAALVLPVVAKEPANP